MKAVCEAQVEEVIGMAAYAYMEKCENNSKKKAILYQMSADEQKHATLWESYAHKGIKPKAITMF